MESAPTFLKRQSTSRHGAGSRFSCTVHTCGVCGRLSSSAKTPRGLSCSSKATLSTDASIRFSFIWSSLYIGNSRDGQSRPALRQCSYFLTFLRHNSTNSTAEHSASTNKSAGRAASPVCGIRNVGAVVCAGGVVGGVSSAGVCALTGAGIVLACSGVNRPLSSSCSTKGESEGKGSEFFHG